MAQKKVSINVHSSFIKSAVYDTGKEVLRLEIGDCWYYYYGITLQKAARFRNSQSKGKYFCTYIKGKYESSRRRKSL